MKNKIWPYRPQKWPLDLNDLGRGWVICTFFKSVYQAEKEELWLYELLTWYFIDIFKKIVPSNWLLFLPPSRGLCKFLTMPIEFDRKFSKWQYSADHKNCIDILHCPKMNLKKTSKFQLNFPALQGPCPMLKHYQKKNFFLGPRR